MSYDLSRLTRKGLVRRTPRANACTLAGDGIRIAIFYTEVHDRLLTPLCAAGRPPATIELQHALRAIDEHVHGHIDRARMGTAA